MPQGNSFVPLTYANEKGRKKLKRKIAILHKLRKYSTAKKKKSIFRNQGCHYSSGRLLIWHIQSLGFDLHYKKEENQLHIYILTMNNTKVKLRNKQT
jgi:hypothetical protein